MVLKTGLPMPNGTAPRQDRLTFEDNRLLPALVGPGNAHLALIEQLLGIRIDLKGNEIVLAAEDGGEAEGVSIAAVVLRNLYDGLRHKNDISEGDVRAAVRLARDAASAAHAGGAASTGIQLRTPRRVITPRSPNQARYLEALFARELVFGVGPAGTGKTYLAVAYAVQLMTQGMVDRIILSRPAVEAGERLGFLPGDLKEKVDPYLQPLYDALHDNMPGDRVQKKLDQGDIEIAPLAFMRGRTLSNAVVILDEAQNTTPMQMKMFLTRLGENSRMVVTGDPSQTDLPPGKPSGLTDALDTLRGVDGVSVVRFLDSDVVRHPLVTRIVRAYNAHSRSAESAYGSGSPGAASGAATPDSNGPETSGPGTQRSET